MLLTRYLFEPSNVVGDATKEGFHSTKRMLHNSRNVQWINDGMAKSGGLVRMDKSDILGRQITGKLAAIHRQ